MDYPPPPLTRAEFAERNRRRAAALHTPPPANACPTDSATPRPMRHGPAHPGVATARLVDLLAKTLDIVDHLVRERNRLRAQLAHLNRKVAHGCTDAHCPECDGQETDTP